jgi:hypothetical protein
MSLGRSVRGSRARSSLAFIILLLQVPEVSPGNAEEQWVIEETLHVRVESQTANVAQASWYAGVVERVPGEITDLFGAPLERSVRVRLYTTEDASMPVHPTAERAQDILEYADPARSVLTCS